MIQTKNVMFDQGFLGREVVQNPFENVKKDVLFGKKREFRRPPILVEWGFVVIAHFSIPSG